MRERGTERENERERERERDSEREGEGERETVRERERERGRERERERKRESVRERKRERVKPMHEVSCPSKKYCPSRERQAVRQQCMVCAKKLRDLPEPVPLVQRSDLALKTNK